MTSRIVFGILLGATIGFAAGYLSFRAGGACPILCNPYRGAIFGAVVGALLAASLRDKIPSYTPSPHLLSIETAEAFEQEVLQADRPVLVEFYTPACRHCRRLEPVVHSLADRFAGRATIAKLDGGALRDISRRYRIRAVPALLLFVGGQEVDRTVGYQREEKLAALIEQYAPAPAP